MNVIWPAPVQQKTRIDAHAHAAANMITVILRSPAHFAASATRKTRSREYDYSDSWKPCALRGQRKAKDYKNLFAHSAK